MNYQDKKITSLDFNPFLKIGSEWALLGASRNGASNAMTVSWGETGVLWNKPIFTVFVRPTRHTFSLLEKTDIATLSFFGGEKKKELSYFGSVSGRDEDKLGRSGLKSEVREGALLFDDAKLTLVGRKLYYTDINPAHFIDETLDSNYSGDYHRAYTYEIIDILK